MIQSPFRYEANFKPEDYETLGRLSASLFSHRPCDCELLKRFLHLNDDEAQAIVFQLTADRFDRILELDKLKPLRKKEGRARLGGIMFADEGS